MLDKTDPGGAKGEPVVVKKYANRRLYNTETSTYVTLDDLGKMVRSDRDFVVYDAKTGDDLTHSVLTQIIVDQESRGSGPTLLPTPFLRQLIRFYDDIGVSPMVPSYLQMSLEALAREQERLRSQFASGWDAAASLEAYNEQVRKNMAMFENAMRMWTPTVNNQAPPATEPKATDAAATNSEETGASTGSASAQPSGSASSGSDEDEDAQSRATVNDRSELTALREQLADMQRKIEELARSR